MRAEERGLLESQWEKVEGGPDRRVYRLTGKARALDFERRTITLNASEKGGNPRIFKVSPKPIEMLNNLPRKIRKSSQFQALEGHNGIPQTKDPLHLRSCLDAKNLIRHYFTFK